MMMFQIVRIFTSVHFILVSLLMFT